jgi:hypothetical protein
MYLKEKTRVSESKDITTETIVKCLKLVDYASYELQSLPTFNNQVSTTENKPASLKNLQFKLYILIYITQNGSILRQVDELNILPFLLRAYGTSNNSTLQADRSEKEAIDDVILSILANMAFEEKLREKIINFKRLNEVLDKIQKKKRDVLRLLANLTLSKNFDVSIILDKHIEQAIEAIRIPEHTFDKNSIEKKVSLTCISCLCVVLNLTSKGPAINTKFLELGLTRHLCNLISGNISDQKVVPLSLMIFSNLVTYQQFSDRIFNDTIDTIKQIHEMTYNKLKRDTKYHQDQDKIFNKIFFLLSYSRLSLEPAAPKSYGTHQTKDQSRKVF